MYEELGGMVLIVLRLPVSWRLMGLMGDLVQAHVDGVQPYLRFPTLAVYEPWSKLLVSLFLSIVVLVWMSL